MERFLFIYLFVCEGGDMLGKQFQFLNILVDKGVLMVTLWFILTFMKLNIQTKYWYMLKEILGVSKANDEDLIPGGSNLCPHGK